MVSALALSLFACTTVEKVGDVELALHDSYVGHNRVDSVLLRDSIFIREKSDTVFYAKYRTVYKERLRVDTIVRCDTLFRDREVVVEKVHRVGYNSGLLWKLPLVAFALFLLWRTGVGRLLLNIILKVWNYAKKFFV